MDKHKYAFLIEEAKRLVKERYCKEGHHTVVAAVIVELKLVVGEVLWRQFRLAFKDDVTFTPTTLPGAYNQFTQTAAVVITTSAG